MSQPPSPPPGSAGYSAWKIMAGPGSLKEKREQLEALAAQFPNDEGVTGYFESLTMQEELERMRGNN